MSNEKLIKQAAEMLRQECPWREGTRNYKEWYDDRRKIADELDKILFKSTEHIDAGSDKPLTMANYYFPHDWP